MLRRLNFKKSQWELLSFNYGVDVGVLRLLHTHIVILILDFQYPFKLSDIVLRECKKSNGGVRHDFKM